MHLVAPIPDVRPLSPQEHQLLEWLLSRGTPSMAAYLTQLPWTTVVARCGRGCPTIDLAVDGHTANHSAASKILVDVPGVSPEGVRIAVIVVSREGLLSELEICPVAGHEGKFSLPRIEDLEWFDA